MGGGQADLVAVGRITGGGFARDDALRQFAGARIGHRQQDVPRPGHAHRLIDIGPSRKRVADGAAQTGGRPAEGLDFRRMVVGFVLELKQPFLFLAVHIHIHEDAAGVVLLTHFHIVQFPLLTQIPGSDGRQFHQTQALALASERLADVVEGAQLAFQLFFEERIVDFYFGQFRGKGGVAAVVAPVGVEDAEFRFGRYAALFREVFHHFPEIVRVHRQPPFLAESGVFLFFQFQETGHVREGLDLRFFCESQVFQVFRTGLDGIDEILADFVQIAFRQVVIENEQAGGTDADVGMRIDQVDAVHGRRRPLVKLTGDVFDGQVFLAFQVAVVADPVGHDLTEHTVAGLFQQFVAESVQIVHIQQTQGLEMQGQILVKLLSQAARLHLETGIFFYKYSAGIHIAVLSFIIHSTPLCTS